MSSLQDDLFTYIASMSEEAQRTLLAMIKSGQITPSGRMGGASNEDGE